MQDDDINDATSLDHFDFSFLDALETTMKESKPPKKRIYNKKNQQQQQQQQLKRKRSPSSSLVKKNKNDDVNDTTPQASSSSSSEFIKINVTDFELFYNQFIIFKQKIKTNNTNINFINDEHISSTSNDNNNNTAEEKCVVAIYLMTFKQN